MPIIKQHKQTRLLDLIDFRKLDTLLEGFNKSTGFVTAILDLEGNILSQSGWRQICTEFHRVNPETAKNCNISDTRLANKQAGDAHYHFYQCLNGLIDVAVPIIINGEHIANLFSGQLFLEEPDRSFFQQQAGKYGFDQDKYLEAIDKVPVVSEEKARLTMDFLLNMARLISEMTLQKLEQTELNKALRVSEERFRIAQEMSPDGFTILHPIRNEKGEIVDFTFIYENQTIARINNTDPKKVIGKRLLELFPTHRGTSVFDTYLLVANTGKPKILDEVYVGEVISRPTWLRLVVVPMGEDIAILSQDLTERKQAELKQQLQFNIARATITTRNLNELFEFIKKELNSIIDAKNFVIAFYNEASGMLSANVDKDEKDEIPEWPAEKSITGYVIRQNRPLLLKKNEILRLHKEGIIELYGTIPETWLGVPLKVEGKILGAVVVQNYDNADTYDQTSIEIMELVSHELSLFIDWQGAEGKATKLFRAVEQSSVSVMITNREGVIEYVNPFFTKLTGYSLEEVMGENPNILQSGHQSNAFYHKLWDTILSGNDWEGEMLNKKKNGDLYWEQAVISPIVNSEGVVTDFVAIKEDITERKKMLEDLVAAKEKAEESDRLKSAFLANVSHEIRTPMNGIMGFADILKRPNLSDAEREKYISIIEKSGVRLLHIINDIIDISKIETGMMKAHIRESNINEQVEYIYAFFKHEVKAKGIEFAIADSLPANKAIVYTDREKVFAILTNLVKNAIKFTKEGSIELGVVTKGDFLEFYVKDTGIGIPESRQEAIFERFIQADIDDKMALQGNGLGLSISKAYVEMLGGNIWVESKEGVGSTFYFTLPYNTPLPIATILSAFPMV